MNIRPTSNYHYWKATQPKPKKDKRMITVEQCLLFAEWLHERYMQYEGKWIVKTNLVRAVYSEDTKTGYTTRELWEAYNRFLGAKPKNTAP
jgi:hypothetical protein